MALHALKYTYLLYITQVLLAEFVHVERILLFCFPKRVHHSNREKDLFFWSFSSFGRGRFHHMFTFWGPLNTNWLVLEWCLCVRPRGCPLCCPLFVPRLAKNKRKKKRLGREILKPVFLSWARNRGESSDYCYFFATLEIGVCSFPWPALMSTMRLI